MVKARFYRDDKGNKDNSREPATPAQPPPATHHHKPRNSGSASGTRSFVKFTHVSIPQRREMGPTLYVPGLQAFYYVCCLQHEFPCLTVPGDVTSNIFKLFDLLPVCLIFLVRLYLLVLIYRLFFTGMALTPSHLPYAYSSYLHYSQLASQSASMFV